MAIIDIFKKKKPKKEKEKPEAKKKPAVPKEQAAIEPVKEKADKIVGKLGKKVPRIAPRVLVSPRVTEKAMALASQNQYVFEIFPRANKMEVKKAIKEVYDVDVERVRIINIPKKKRRLGKTSGWKPGYKKAIIKLKKGQKIDVGVA